MKTTVVPAQITTVEDKIAGNLNFTQLMLMTLPVFLDGALFVLLPPIFKPTPIKVAVAVIIAILCLTLAIRIKGKIILSWLAIIGRYNTRPRFYLFNKNDVYLRIDESKPAREIGVAQPEVSEPEPLVQPSFEVTSDLVRIENAIADPRAAFHFKAEKGGLRVHIREIKKEGL